MEESATMTRPADALAAYIRFRKDILVAHGAFSEDEADAVATALDRLHHIESADVGQLKEIEERAQRRHALPWDQDTIHRAIKELEADRATLLAVVKRQAGEIAEQKAALDRIANPHIKSLNIHDGELLMALDAPEMAKFFAVSFWNLLDQSNAKNYAELTFADPEKPLKKVIVTIRKIYGQTPDDMRRTAEQERDAARAEVAQLRKEITESEIDRQAAEGKVAELDKRIAELHGQREEARAGVEHLRSANQTLLKQRDDFQTAHERDAEERARLSAEVVRLERDVASLTSESDYKTGLFDRERAAMIAKNVALRARVIELGGDPEPTAMVSIEEHLAAELVAARKRGDVLAEGLREEIRWLCGSRPTRTKACGWFRFWSNCTDIKEADHSPQDACWYCRFNRSEHGHEVGK
jgi:septal ring factor EnvC (AmiA/AmiB activator)